MKKKSLILFILFYLFFLIPVWAEPSVVGSSAILIDAKTGRVLYEKNADEKMYPASTTKVVTGLLAVEKGNFSDIVTVGINPSTKIERGSSQIYLIPDEQLTFEQLIYALMLSSANDAAIAIAEHISGSVENFSDLMNSRAKELGAVNTNFVNPNGLHDDNHYTTARDLSFIAFNAMKNEVFRKIVATYSYTIPATNKQEAREYIRNSNKLIWNSSSNSAYYEYATGIKTGYTVKAKHCLVASAEKDGMELIAVVLGTEKNNLYSDITNMFEYGFSNFSFKTILEKNQVIATVTVPNTEVKINLLAEEGMSLTLSEGEESLIKSATVINENIAPPIVKGQALGSISYAMNGEVIKTINLIASEDYVPEPPAPIKAIKNNWQKWVLAAAALFLIYRTIVTVFRIKRRNRRNKTLFVKR